jgi:hypothetical protein
LYALVKLLVYGGCKFVAVTVSPRCMALGMQEIPLDPVVVTLSDPTVYRNVCMYDQLCLGLVCL